MAIPWILPQGLPLASRRIETWAAPTAAGLETRGNARIAALAAADPTLEVVDLQIFAAAAGGLWIAILSLATPGELPPDPDPTLAVAWIDDTDSPWSFDPPVTAVMVDSTAGPVDIVLPAIGATPVRLVVVDVGGASEDPGSEILIIQQGTDLIQGLATPRQLATNFGHWDIIGSVNPGTGLGEWRFS